MRALNMQALTEDVQAEHPGVVIYGKGDSAHAEGVSGHNEDDTPGVRAELQDSDTKPEHRAIDIMVGPNFTKADGDALVAALLADPAARARLYYIIWYGYIWSRSHNWEKRPYTGADPHKNHVHASGWAADDDNTAGWPAVSKGAVKMFCSKGQTGVAVKALQVRLKNLGFDPGAIDGDYGDGTAAALKKACLAISPTTGADGSAFDHYTTWMVSRLEDKRRFAEDSKALLDKLAAAEKRTVTLEGQVKALQSAPAPVPSAGLNLPLTVAVTGGVLQIDKPK